jgi:cell division protein FtsW
VSKKRKILILQNIDKLLLITIITLLIGGMVMLASASMPLAERSFGDPFAYLYKQSSAVFLGIISSLIFFLTPSQYWEKLGILTPIFAIGLLSLVFIPDLGVTVNGATRWVKLGPLPNIQVVDPARLLFFLYIAGYCVRQQEQLRMTFVSFLKPMIFIVPACLLLLLQPDFGSTVVLLIVTAALFFVAGFKFRYFTVLVLALVGILGLLAYISPYRMARITSFMNPWDDPFNSGYQLTQSLIAIGRGQWFGVGLGEGVQKLFYLPEAHTDFIFAVIAEELGLIGSLLIIGLYAVLIWRIFSIALKAINRKRIFQGYLSFAIAIWFTTQVIINIGVNMGLLPTKGLTLPLISYGRSSMIITLITLAIVLRIGCENPRTKVNKKIGN